MDDDITSIYELLDAIEAVIKAADPAKREALTRTIDAYAESFPRGLLLGHRLTSADTPAPPAQYDRLGMPSGGTIEAAPRHPVGRSQVGRQRLTLKPPKCHPRHRDACALSTLPRRPARD